MSDDVKFIPYELAKKIVGAVMEEEHIHESGRRILTVYDLKNRELCWYDAEDILAEVAEREGALPRNKDEVKVKAVELILHMIPQWAVEQILAEMGQGR
ncbi:MAG: hypothetical protein AB1413_12050 [Thermodesulfobacteriota bacterium]